MIGKESVLRDYTGSEYRYLYNHTPFEVLTPYEVVSQISGVYILKTYLPIDHYTRPTLAMFKVSSGSIKNQKIVLQDAAGEKTSELLISTGYSSSLEINDIKTNDNVMIYLDFTENVASLVNVNGATPGGSYFTNTYGDNDFPDNAFKGDMLWKTIYSLDPNNYENSEMSIYNDGKKIIQYPVTPRQIYYATDVVKTSLKYNVTLGEFPLSNRITENAKYGVIFLAKIPTESAGNDTITVDGINYDEIKIGNSEKSRNLFANEVASDQTCTFQINEDGHVYLLFIDGKAATGAGSSITLSETEPINPVEGDEWLEIIKEV